MIRLSLTGMSQFLGLSQTVFLHSLVVILGNYMSSCAQVNVLVL